MTSAVNRSAAIKEARACKQMTVMEPLLNDLFFYS